MKMCNKFSFDEKVHTLKIKQSTKKNITYLCKKMLLYFKYII